MASVDWMHDEATGINWTVQLKKQESGLFLCQRCECGHYHHRPYRKRNIEDLQGVQAVVESHRGLF